MKSLTFKEIEELKHKNSIAQLTFIRATEKIKHAYNLEAQRIKNAEMRKHLEKKIQSYAKPRF